MFIIGQEQPRWEAPDRNFVGHRDIVTRSLARYHFVAPHIHGITLDIGCGRGYGFEIIQSRSVTEVGLDLSYEFLQDAQLEFPSVPFLCATGDVLPFCDSSFDSIIAFEVVEHIESDLGFLRELKRVARDDAFIAISTPNRLASSGDSAQPLNPFHVREYDSTEFHALLSQVFSSVTLFGQHERAESSTSTPGLRDSLVDRVPMRWKYLLPAHIQDLFSVVLRPPLQLEQCQFEAQELNNAHTLIALCRP